MLPAPIESPAQRLRRTPACLRCDYDFTGFAGDTCPECGARYSEADLDVIRSLPEWRERYLARSRGPVIAAYSLALGLAPFAGLALADAGGRSFRTEPLFAGAALVALGAGGGVVALLGSARSAQRALRAMWLRTSVWLYAPWCAVIGLAPAFIPGRTLTYMSPIFLIAAVGFVPLGNLMWRQEWADAEDELEVRPSPARRAALRALSWIIPIAGGVLAVRYLVTAALWRL